MAITKAFGFILDGGIMRRWYQDRNGVRRWADNDKPVEIETR